MLLAGIVLDIASYLYNKYIQSIIAFMEANRRFTVFHEVNNCLFTKHHNSRRKSSRATSVDYCATGYMVILGKLRS